MLLYTPVILSWDEYLTSALVTQAPCVLVSLQPHLRCQMEFTNCEISFTGIYVVVTGLRAHNARITADLPSVEIWAQ